MKHMTYTIYYINIRVHTLLVPVHHIYPLVPLNLKMLKKLVIYLHFCTRVLVHLQHVGGTHVPGVY